MEIKFHCVNPACGQKIAVDASSVGTAFPCPSCGHSNLVPAQPDATGKTPSLKQIEIACSNRSCGRVMQTDELHIGSSLTCPDCGKKTKVPKIAVEKPLTPSLSPSEGERAAAGRVREWPRTFFTTILTPFRLLARIPIGVWVILLILGAVGTRMVMARPKLPANFETILNEISSVGEIRGAPMVNYAGTRLWFARDSEKGVGVYQVDLTTLKRQQMTEISELDYEDKYFELFGWSPDDRYLVFAQRSTSGKTHQELTVCDGFSGQFSAAIEVNGFVQNLAWLTTNALVYLDDIKIVHWLERTPGGIWQERKKFVLQAGLKHPKHSEELKRVRELAKKQPLLATSGTTVAYVANGNLWSLDLPTGKRTQLSHLSNTTFEWLNYSRENGEFLFCKNEGGANRRYLYRFKPSRMGSSRGDEAQSPDLGSSRRKEAQMREPGSNRGEEAQIKPQQIVSLVTSAATQVENYEEPRDSQTPSLAPSNGVRSAPVTSNTGGQLTQVTFGNEHTFNGRWLQNGSGFVYVSNPKNNTYLAVRPKIASLQTNLFTEGFIRSFSVSPDGHSIYALASITNEPQGIWKYSVANQELRCVVPGTDKPFVASKIIPALKAEVPTKQGNLSYIIVPPRDFNRHKKYPVVIDGPTEGRWKAHSQFLANMGIYYVAVNRRGLSSSDELSGAAGDIVNVYRHLIENPNMDPSQVFLVGFSAGTSVVSELVEKHPDWWAGIILNNPSRLPTLPPKIEKYPRILISMGETERSADYVEKFRQKAGENMIPLKMASHEKAGHVFRNTDLAKERNRLLAKFVFEDH